MLFIQEEQQLSYPYEVLPFFVCLVHWNSHTFSISCRFLPISCLVLISGPFITFRALCVHVSSIVGTDCCTPERWSGGRSRVMQRPIADRCCTGGVPLRTGQERVLFKFVRIIFIWVKGGSNVIYRPWRICGELQTRSKNKWIYLMNML